MKIERDTRAVLLMLLVGFIMALIGYQLGKWLALAG